MLFTTTVTIFANEAAFDLARKFAVKNGVIKTNIELGIKNAVWKKDKSAVAMSFQGVESSLCIVVYKNEKFLVSDVSKVENDNFANLGFKRLHYDRYLTEPTVWTETGRFNYTNFSDRTLHQITFRTRAWRNGQRYTVSESLILDEAWKPLWR